MADGPGGVRAALAEAIGEDEGEPNDVQANDVQALLFDELDAGEVGALDAPSPLSALFTPRKGGGRRPGSRNRRTEATVAWLLSQHRHPLLVMMEAYSMTPQALADKLGLAADKVDLLEVYKLQLRMAEAVAPYVAQRLPQAVQIDARAGVTLSFEGVSLPARAGSAGDLAGDLVEGLALQLPFKSDGDGRTDA